MRVPSWSIVAAALAGPLAVAAPAGAQAREPEAPAVAEQALSDEGELALIVGLVEAAKYEECVARLGRLLDPKGERPLKRPEVIERARIYQATCFFGLGKPEEADAPLRAAIQRNPQMRAPDSLVFPPKVVERFLKVREELYSELQASSQVAIEKSRREAAEKQRRESEERAKMLALERLARQEVVITKNRRWIAVVPFGVGQFQNGNSGLGWVFFGSETLLLGTALAATAVHTHLVAEVEEIRKRGRVADPEVSKRLDDWHLALVVSSYGFLGVAALGILEAQLSFVPEVRTVRERKLPNLTARRALTITPDVAAGPSGFSLGVRGAF